MLIAGTYIRFLFLKKKKTDILNGSLGYVGIYIYIWWKYGWKRLTASIQPTNSKTQTRRRRKKKMAEIVATFFFTRRQRGPVRCLWSPDPVHNILTRTCFSVFLFIICFCRSSISNDSLKPKKCSLPSFLNKYYCCLYIHGAPFESSWTLEFGVLNWNLLHHINSLSLSL